MMRLCALILATLLAATAAVADMKLAAGGETDYVIVVDPEATVAEKHAADELASFLGEVTGADFPVIAMAQVPDRPALIVGPGRAARELAPDLDFDGLSPDGIIIETRPAAGALAPADVSSGRTRALPPWATPWAAALRRESPTAPSGPGADRAAAAHLILAGDRPRGTLYAVYSFLEDTVGCRWWSSTASTIPQRPELIVPAQHVRYVPPLEYREVFWWDAFDGDWAVRNKSNGNRAQLDEQHGGHITYQGFVHTFNRLVPPGEYFAEHPEWFSERDGRRIGADGARTQLCLTNPEVLDFTIARVREQLAANPTASVVSVSQNDWDNHCLCANCRALEEQDGSPAGPLLRFVNAVAAAIAEDYPDVAVDTLAYQYTRRPPTGVTPLPNVIVRLCSIECSFLQPLASEVNASFGDDLRGWNEVSNRLWVWDYTTNFGHYIQPHPNLRVLGPNIRFFVENGVTGVFEQGAYQSPGGEMAELKAWMLAKLLWDPTRDTDELIEEFTSGYYGAAGSLVREYIDLLHDTAEATGHYLRIGSGPTAPFFTLDFMGRAWALFDEAEAAVADDPEVLNRVQMARLPLRYVWAVRWHEFEAQARREGLDWPGPDDYVANAQTFMEVARRNGVTRLSEGRAIDTFEARTIGLGRITSPPPPGCESLGPDECIDLQDRSFRLAREGTWAALEHDETASDHVAARMPGTHHEWAVQQDLGIAGLDPEATYTVYAAVRVTRTGDEGLAFTAGVYDVENRVGIGGVRIECRQIEDDAYHVYEIATGRLHGRMYIWVAPPENPDQVEAVWVDRFWLVRQDD